MESLILVGGGLANGLIAHFLAHTGSKARPLIIEQRASLGGNHTWSFHHGDVSTRALSLLEPLVKKSWPSQKVVFPTGERELPMPYYSMTSFQLHDALMREMGDRVLLRTHVREVGARHVEFDDGRTLFANAVIDARGPAPSLPRALPVGFQKFLGQEVELEQPHGLDAPVIMDARAPQVDGFRFFYLLPWTATSLLIEDTYYSDSAKLSHEALRAGIRSYAHQRGWRIRDVIREETGVLPIPLGGELDELWPESSPIARAGSRAGLFHATTGYSLPDAAHVAESIADAADLDHAALYSLLRGKALATWNRGRFFRFLNRMLFRAAEPSERIAVFERFYKLPDGLIRRFYQGRLRVRDGARLLVGKPPVDFRRALQCLRESAPEAPSGELTGA